MVLLGGAALALSLPLAAARPAKADQQPNTGQSAAAQFTLPAPTGPYRLGTTSLHLVDASRPDPWVPAQPVRNLMIQFWYPAAVVRGYHRAPWLTPAAARAYERANGLPVLNWPTTHAHLGAPALRRGGGWPVVLYSHGLGGNRTELTALVEDLASHGHVVVAIDHVHDAGVVELPGGRVELGAIPELTKDNEVPLTIRAVQARATDTRFVLDQLAAIGRGQTPDHGHRPLPPGLRDALDLDRIGMFGHSDGGATTAHAMHADARIAAGINLDGTLWTPQGQAGSDRPILLFGKQDLDPYQASTWAVLWPNQRGPKLWLNLTGATHPSFEDFAILLPQAALILGIPPQEVTAVVGPIGGLRASAVLRPYVNAYFDRYLRHRAGALLDGPSARYPEVQFTR